MRSTYESLIHGHYFPPSPQAAVPPHYDRVVEAILAVAGNGGIGQLLEVGPETPANPEFVAQRLKVPPTGYHLVEISRPALDRLTRAGWSATSADLSSEALPFPAGSIDVAIMSEVLEHLVDPDHALDELRRVLKPDGLLVVTTPNLAAWFNRLLLLIGVQPAFTETGTRWVFGRRGLLRRSRPVGHLRILTFPALLELVEFHGFEAVRAEGLAASGGGMPTGGLGWLDRRMARFPTISAGLLVVARRRPD